MTFRYPARIVRSIIALPIIALVLAACSSEPQGPEERGWYDDDRSGGGATVHDASLNAFGYVAPTMNADGRIRFPVGNSFFRNNWVQRGASTTGRDGLGPLFHARSCGGCHERDGRGSPPENGKKPLGLLLRLNHDPIYGGQLDVSALPDVRPEGSYTITYRDSLVRYGDGTVVPLRVPRYTITDLGYGPLAASTQLSPRLAQQLIGLGLLEAISDQDIDAQVARQSALGLRGRTRIVRTSDGSSARGRFGWKCGQPTVREQTTAAFVGDLGITTSARPYEDLSATQHALIPDIYSGGTPEANDATLSDVVLYTRSLAVPARRNVTDAAVRNGARTFESIGCTSCHVPTFTTSPSHPDPAFAGQTIHPFTDMLLHDMGPGLADAMNEEDVEGAQWRTPPLWGLGLLHTVNGFAFYLHDGRARTLEEAILWHGGEAEPVVNIFRALPADRRLEIIRFLESL